MGLLKEVHAIFSRLLVLLRVEELAGLFELDVCRKDYFRAIEEKEWREAG